MNQLEDHYARRNRALAFAARAHRDQLRKGTEELADDLDQYIGTGVPYIMHPAAVGMLLLEHGEGDDVVIAGILHDVLEDTDANAELVEQEFGPKVAELVAAESEPEKSLPWRERKQYTIDHLERAELDVKVIAAADKLHNVQSIQLDLADLGPSMWDRFNAPYEDQRWYYREICKTLGANGDTHPLFDKLKQTVETVFPH